MKAFRIFALLLVMGVSQAGATGFAYNMNQAQKMLKVKKEVVARKKVTMSEVRIEKDERKAEGKESVYLERSAALSEVEEPISEGVVGTFSQWFSQILMKLLTAGFGGR